MTFDISNPVYLLFPLFLVLIIMIWAFSKQRLKTIQQRLDAANALIEQHQHHQTTLQKELGSLSEKARHYDIVLEEKRELSNAYNNLQSNFMKVQSQNEAQKARLDALMQSHEEKLALMSSAEQRLQSQFENLANRIFDEKNARYHQQSKQDIEALLAPFKTQLDSFKQQVTEQHIREGQERASLKTEILGLKELNQKITQEAAALTNALKGDNKTQGNWGEVILERILKESGLREGHEFETQVAAQSEQGRRLQPDVVVHLPNDKDVIIDAKVSLASYERYFNESDENVRKQHLLGHVNSIKGHIKGLGAKDYQAISSLRTLDYVLLFIPIESAFLLAIEEEPSLVSLALDNNIMLVSPTNLLVALRTINNIWQYEYQNQNAQHIAEQAAKLYDKFVGFVTDMERVGKSLDTAQSHYDLAVNKLSQGRGNLLRQIEKFREMGVQPSKKLSNTGLKIQENDEE